MDERKFHKYILYAFGAILIWSSLAILGTKVESVPSLLLVGVSLSVGGSLSIFKVRQWKVPFNTILIGVGGIFGYHYLIFTAYKLAPIIEVNILNYLWPLFIVFMSPLILPSFSLRKHHIIGTLLGTSGAALIITGGRLEVDPQYILGYLMAAGAALVWATYSLMQKRVAPFPTGAVGGFCLVSGILSLVIYLAESSTAGFYSPTVSEWVSLVLLGLGPMGSAFYLWDKALKEGDPRIIGSISYLTLLLATLWLILFTEEKLTIVSGFGIALLLSGSVIGSLNVLRSTQSARSV
jgi:drug/metabolite transporter (DMT)-like permease